MDMIIHYRASEHGEVRLDKKFLGAISDKIRISTVTEKSHADKQGKHKWSKV